MIIRQGQVTAGNVEVTGLNKFSDLAVGMYVYGAGIPVGTKISIVDEGSSVIELSKAPTAGTGIYQPLQFTSVCPGIYVERCEALKDVKSMIDERGDFIKIILREEDDVGRDAYNSIKKRERNSEYFMKAYPVETRPSDKQLEKAGIREKVDVTVYTSTLDWMNLGIGHDDIEFANRTTVVWNGNTYEIKDKGLVSQMNDVFLYTTLGLSKR